MVPDDSRIPFAICVASGNSVEIYAQAESGLAVDFVRADAVHLATVIALQLQTC